MLNHWKRRKGGRGRKCINKTSQTGVQELRVRCARGKNHHDVSTQTAQTATKQYVHPESRRHYSTALKIKGGKEKEEEQVKSHFVVLM